MQDATLHHTRNPKEAAVNVGQAQLKLVEEILKHNQLVQQRKNLHDVSPPPRAERRRPRRGPVPTPMGAAARPPPPSVPVRSHCGWATFGPDPT